MGVDSAEKSDGEGETVKNYFEEAQWNKLSICEKKKFEVMLRNVDSLLAKGLNVVVPQFMSEKKKKTEMKPSLGTYVKKSEFASNNAPPSLICYSQKPPIEENNIHNKKHPCPASSSEISNKRKVNQFPEESECRSRVMGGILANGDVRKRSVVEKESEENVALEVMNYFDPAKRIYTREIVRKYEKCPHCDYSDVRHLKRHIQEVHERRKPYQCKKCDYKAARMSGLQDHVYAVHDGIKPYSCEKCAYKAYEKRSVKYHMDSAHEEKKPYKCPICDFSSAYPRNLPLHIKNIHEKM